LCTNFSYKARKNITYEEEDEESDSDEENNEDEDEKENARNKLKALLGGSSGTKKKLKLSSNHSTVLRKSSSYNENDNKNSDFLYVIEKMKNDLFDKLEIVQPEEDDDEDNIDVSKIFYEGREGQKYTVEVLEKFFANLKNQAKYFAHQLTSPNDKPKERVEEREKVKLLFLIKTETGEKKGRR